MPSVVEADGENLNWVQGGEEFGDLRFFAGGLKAAEKVAFQKKGGAVSLKFGKGDSALRIEVTDYFHRSGFCWRR